MRIGRYLLRRYWISVKLTSGAISDLFYTMMGIQIENITIWHLSVCLSRGNEASDAVTILLATRNIIFLFHLKSIVNLNIIKIILINLSRCLHIFWNSMFLQQKIRHAKVTALKRLQLFCDNVCICWLKFET